MLTSQHEPGVCVLHVLFLTAVGQVVMLCSVISFCNLILFCFVWRRQNMISSWIHRFPENFVRTRNLTQFHHIVSPHVLYESSRLSFFLLEVFFWCFIAFLLLLIHMQLLMVFLRRFMFQQYRTSMSAVVVNISMVVIETQVKDVLLFLRDHDVVSPRACLSTAGSSRKNTPILLTKLLHFHKPEK